MKITRIFDDYGLLVCAAKRGSEKFVLLEGISTDVAVRGFVAQVKATLRYKNKSSDPMEVVFKCPVDEGSAIYHVEAKLDGRTVIGRCLEKKKAEKVYQDAVADGRTALLMRQDVRTADVISLALGNLPPESSAEVTLSLVCDLAVANDGGVQFTLPTLLNPRYNPIDGPAPEPDFSTDAPYVMYVPKPYAIEVTASVIGGQSISRVVSHTDPINVAIEEDSKQAKITLDGGAFHTDHDWSFVVYYNNPYQPHALVETGDCTEVGLMKDQVLMINMFPELSEDSYSHYNEVIFIIDRSGSMGGGNMQNAKAVLLLFLKSLPPGCRFNVISFGSSHSLLFPEGSREYNEANLALAVELHQAMEADMGGTEILEPLKRVYSTPADLEYSRQILLLTDGQVFNVDQVLELVTRNASNTRVFSVGIGAGASTALVKGLARAGGGRAELVTERDRMQTKVMGLVSSMLQSSVQKVSVSCEMDTPARLHLVPEVPTIFAGQHLITYARMPPKAQLKSLKLTGIVDGLPWTASLNQDQVKTVHDASLPLHRLAAKALIKHDYTDDSDDARQEAVALSTSSGVLSRHTAIVAVDQDGKTLQAVANCHSPSVNMPLMSTNSLASFMRTSGAPKPCSSNAMGGIIPLAKKRGFRSVKRCPQICASRESYGSVQCGALSLSYVDPPSAAAPPPCYGDPPSGARVCDSMMKMDKSSSSRKKLASNMLIPLGAADACDDVLEDLQPTNETDNDDALSELISCQKFDGSWNMEDISSTISVGREELKLTEFAALDDSILATGLAIVILQEGFSDRKQEWQLLANKAKNFLRQKLSFAEKSESGNDLESFLGKVKQLYDELRLSYPKLAGEPAI